METPVLAAVWKALADPSRRKILDLLREKPSTTQELCEQFAFSRYAVMKHLKVLTDAGLVLVRREGRQRWNHLNAVPIQQIYERWVSRFEGSWAASLLNLKGGLEQGANMSEKSFHIEQEVTIAAPVSRVYRAIIQDLQSWWGAPYHLTHNPQALIIEPQVGGRLYEQGEKGAALWGIVQSIEEDDHIVFEGRMGMLGAIFGVLTIVVEPAEADGTLVKLTHRAIGDVSEDSQSGYAMGWDDLIGTRLKAFVEEGTRYGLGHTPPPQAKDS
jgi:DNA-binding transcriptional ArsR family regulator/uncharacterized protein YndB with AHSA1/START domain